MEQYQNKKICDIKKISIYLDISVPEVRKLVRGNRLKFDIQKINSWLDEKQEMESKQSIFY